MGFETTREETPPWITAGWILAALLMLSLAWDIYLKTHQQPVPSQTKPEFTARDVALLPKANAIYESLRQIDLDDPARLGDDAQEGVRYSELEALDGRAFSELGNLVTGSYFAPCSAAAHYLFLSWGYASDMNLDDRPPTTAAVATLVGYAGEYGKWFSICEARVFEVSDAVDAGRKKH